MKMRLIVMAGDNAVDAEPILESSSTALINAVVGRLGLMVDDAEWDAMEESDEAQEVAGTPRPDTAAEVQA